MLIGHDLSPPPCIRLELKAPPHPELLLILMPAQPVSDGREKLRLLRVSLSRQLGHRRPSSFQSTHATTARKITTITASANSQVVMLSNMPGSFTVSLFRSSGTLPRRSRRR